MTTTGLLGTWDLDTVVPYYIASNRYEIAGMLFMCQIMYNHAKRNDWHSLLRKYIKGVPMVNVNLVILDVPEAETWLS